MGLSFDDIDDEDIEKQRMIQNPPSHEPGFGGEQPVSNDGFEFDSFSDDNDDFSSGSPFGSFGSDAGGTTFGSFGASASGNAFGSGGFGDTNPFGSGYGGYGQDTKQVDNKNDASEFFISAAKDVGLFFLEVFASLRNRTVDDWAGLSSLWLTIGGIMATVGVVSTVVGAFGDMAFLKLSGVGGTGLFGGLIVVSAGFAGLGINTYLKAKGGEYASTGGTIKQIQKVEQPKEVEEQMEANVFGFEESTDEEGEDGESSMENENTDMANLISSVFGDDATAPMDFPGEEAEPEGEEEEEPEVVDYEKLQSQIGDTPYVNREMLFNTFKGFFPLCSTGFTDIKEYDMGDEEVMKIGSKINQALSVLLPDKEPEIREVQIERLRETHFAYEVTFSRLKVKTLKLDSLAEEMINQFKKGLKDDSISITIEPIGTKNVALITKGATKPVTIGDCLRKPDVEEYIKDTKHKLPFISGITEIGEVEMIDMKDYLSIIITGKPRSGKSWYVNSILSTLVAFNKPEDIQFVVVDPKKTALFKKFSLLPHVCGLHDGTNILELFEEVMNNEAERRKRLFEDAAVDNIWEFRKGNPEVKLPVIMFVIDEIVTIYNDLKAEKKDKEFAGYIQKIFTQLPYLGIGLMLIPHRTTGIIDKLVRMNVSYKVAVMADNEGVEEEVGAKRWNRPLVSPGDMAVKASSWKSAKYLKGTGVALEDKDTRDLLEEMAKAWYKIGVEQPDMTYLGCCVNRDEEDIKEKLKLEAVQRIQYDSYDADD